VGDGRLRPDSLWRESPALLRAGGCAMPNFLQCNHGSLRWRQRPWIWRHCRA